MSSDRAGAGLTSRSELPSRNQETLTRVTGGTFDGIVALLRTENARDSNPDALPPLPVGGSGFECWPGWRRRRSIATDWGLPGTSATRLRRLAEHGQWALVA